MAFLTLLKFALASSALYITKELGLWDSEQSAKIHNENRNILPKLIFFGKDDSKPPCEPCDPEWAKELKSALSGTWKSLQKIPGHWRRFGQLMQDNLKSLFKSDDD